MTVGDLYGVVDGFTLYPEPVPLQPADPVDVQPGAPSLDHLQFPMEIRGGQFVTVPQGSIGEIRGNAALICSCPEGWIDSDPDFGIPDLALTLTERRAQIVQDAVNSREPRARALADEDWADLAARASRITVRIGDPARA